MSAFMSEQQSVASGRRFFPGALVAMVCLAVVASGLARGDEGMWLFNQPPLERLEKDHGFKPTPEWLLHLQQSSVRFNSGGSGSFVSAEGLVLTNHHVGADSLQKLGDDTHDYYRDGFAAVTRDDELRCHDLELNVLISIEDVTKRVQGAVELGMSADDAFAARRKAMAAIEQESLEKTGLRSDVVTLFQGGAYHLYRAKKYTDVRLVFAPERQIAFFGGDADNFEFPRFNLDMCLFRAYEDGKPAKVEHFLAWGSEPVREGELVFVSGHPGHTDRANTMRELVAMRDRQMPMSLAMLRRLEVMLGVYSGQGPEEARQASEDLFGVQNSRKAREGLLAGLLDPRVMARKEEAERHTRLGLRKAPLQKADVGMIGKLVVAAKPSRRVPQRAGDKHPIAHLRTAAAQRLADSDGAHQLHGDRKRAARGITANQRDAQRPQRGCEPARKRLEPVGLGCGNGKRQRRPARRCRHRGEVAQIDCRSPIANIKRRHCCGEMHPFNQGINANCELGIRRQRENGGVVADACGDIVAPQAERSKDLLDEFEFAHPRVLSDRDALSLQFRLCGCGGRVCRAPR